MHDFVQWGEEKKIKEGKVDTEVVGIVKLPFYPSCRGETIMAVRREKERETERKRQTHRQADRQTEREGETARPKKMRDL